MNSILQTRHDFISYESIAWGNDGVYGSDDANRYGYRHPDHGYTGSIRVRFFVCS